MHQEIKSWQNSQRKNGGEVSAGLCADQNSEGGKERAKSPAGAEVLASTLWKRGDFKSGGDIG